MYIIDRNGLGFGKMLKAVKDKRIVRMCRIYEAQFEEDEEKYTVESWNALVVTFRNIIIISEQDLFRAMLMRFQLC